MTFSCQPGSGAQVRLEREGTVATLLVDRPDARNAMGIAVCEAVDALIDEVEADPTIRALVVTGTGEKSFIAGADINDLVAYDTATAWHHIEVGHRLFTRIENLPIATIASVNGYCLGGGLEIAMACDIRLASANARFGLPEMNIGMTPGWGGTERLQRLIGQSRAAAMALTGEMIDLPTALTCGLVYRGFDDVAALRQGTAELAAKLAGFSPIVMRTTKSMILNDHDATPAQTLARDCATLGYLLSTHDAREGLSAFLEKRPAQFTGC